MSRCLHTLPILIFCTIILALVGCKKFEDTIVPPSQQFWTVAGKTYLVGSTDPLPVVVVKCAGLTTTSRSDGSYELHGVPGGTQLLTAEKPDCITYSQTIEINDDMTHHIFLGFNGVDLSGFVTNSVDGPIKGAKVLLRNFMSYTDISGYYQFSNMPQGTDTLHIIHPDYYSLDSALSLRASDAHIDIALKRDSTIQLLMHTNTYVDESQPNQVHSLPDRLYLRANGIDSTGGYHSGIQQYIYLNFYFPQIFRYPAVSILEARLELCTDGPYAPSVCETFAITSPWTYVVSYSNQPITGEQLYSGTVGDNLSGKYFTVIGISGFNQLAATYRETGQFFGVVIKGGRIEPTAFYSTKTLANRPKVTIKVRY